MLISLQYSVISHHIVFISGYISIYNHPDSIPFVYSLRQIKLNQLIHGCVCHFEHKYNQGLWDIFCCMCL